MFPFLKSYPEIDYANFKGALWTFKKRLALKIRIEFLLFPN